MKRKKNLAKPDAVVIDSSIMAFARQSHLSLKSYRILQVFHRPFSIVYKIRIHFNDGSERVYYLKYYRREANSNKSEVVERDFKTTLFWNEHFKTHKEFNVIKPVYCDKQNFILISEESKGQNLSRLINARGQFFPSLNTQKSLLDMLTLVGKWLRYFQSISIEGPYDDLGLDYFLDYVKIRLTRLVDNKKVAFDATLKKQVLEYIERQWAKSTDGDMQYCYVHADLSLSNILISNDSITVLDFNEQETGLIYKDLTRFYHQLHLLNHKPVYQRRLIKNFKKAFLHGYGNEKIYKQPLFKIYLILHIINHLGKTARYWEHDFIENIYNRWIVRNALKELHKLVAES